MERHRAGWAIVFAIALTMAACGGGAGGEDLGDEVFGGIGEESGDVGSEEGDDSSGGADVGPVTQTADPGTGWVEVDGQRFELGAFGSVHHSCELLPDRITVNFQQTVSGHDLTFQASVLDGDWIGNLTFAPSTEDTQVSYGATIGFDAGTLGIGDQAISYEGTVSRVEDFDAQNAQDTQATVAINCATPGNGITAEVGGESFTFPLSGAQSLDCVISDGEAEVMISHSHPERLQLQIDARDSGGQLVGGVFITSGEDNYNSTIPADGTGLTVEGNSLTYEGTFTTGDGQEVEGSATVTCG